MKMDWLMKQKVYAWLITLLVIINSVMLVLLWVDKPVHYPPPPPKPLDTDSFIIKELDLSGEQEKNFIKLRKEHFDTTRAVNDQLWKLKDELREEAFKEKRDEKKVEALFTEIAVKQVEFERLMYKHFVEMREILSKEQAEKFFRILGEANRWNKPPHNKFGGPPPFEHKHNED